MSLNNTILDDFKRVLDQVLSSAVRQRDISERDADILYEEAIANRRAFFDELDREYPDTVHEGQFAELMTDFLTAIMRDLSGARDDRYSRSSRLGGRRRVDDRSSFRRDEDDGWNVRRGSGGSSWGQRSSTRSSFGSGYKFGSSRRSGGTYGNIDPAGSGRFGRGVEREEVIPERTHNWNTTEESTKVQKPMKFEEDALPINVDSTDIETSKTLPGAETFLTRFQYGDGYIGVHKASLKECFDDMAEAIRFYKKINPFNLYKYNMFILRFNFLYTADVSFKEFHSCFSAIKAAIEKASASDKNASAGRHMMSIIMEHIKEAPIGVATAISNIFLTRFKEYMNGGFLSSEQIGPSHLCIDELSDVLELANPESKVDDVRAYYQRVDNYESKVLILFRNVCDEIARSIQICSTSNDVEMACIIKTLGDKVVIDHGGSTYYGKDYYRLAAHANTDAKLLEKLRAAFNRYTVYMLPQALLYTNLCHIDLTNNKSMISVGKENAVEFLLNNYISKEADAQLPRILEIDAEGHHCRRQVGRTLEGKVFIGGNLPLI